MRCDAERPAASGVESVTRCDLLRGLLTPIDTFAGWTRPDGAPVDPWLRTHVWLGGRVIATAPPSQTMTGTVEQWQAWTGLQFPSTGQSVVPGGLAPLAVDRERDLGTSTEPNVWVRHR